MPHQPPTFLTLPLEIRLEIYAELLVLPPPAPVETQQTTYRCSYSYSYSSTPTSPTKTQSKPTLHPQILRVNTQTHAEAVPVLYRQNTFSAHPVYLTAQPTLYHPFHSFPPVCQKQQLTTTTNTPPNPPPPSSSSSSSSSSSQSTISPTQTQHVLPNRNIPLIRSWHLRIRLDSPSPPWESPSSPPPPPGLHTTTTTTHTPHTPHTPNSTTSTTSTTSTLARHFSHCDTLTLDLWCGTFMGGVGADMLRPFEAVRGVRRVRVRGGGLAGFEGYVAWLRERMMISTIRKDRRYGAEGEEEGEREGEGEEEEYVPRDEMEGRRLRGWV